MLKFLIYANILIAVEPLVNSKHVLHLKRRDQQEIESWSGRWFPHAPNLDDDDNSDPHMCDDGQHSIDIDFDPANETHTYSHLCLATNRSQYEPNFATEALLQEDYIPKAYEPAVICLNETIAYDASMPTYGPFRAVPPTYGVYTYLPPQRWMRSLADGAIVMLHHPCANFLQTHQLSSILQGCLYRHVISPSLLLTAERPLALLAWGKSLQMSVVDRQLVMQFIKANAKKGLAVPGGTGKGKYVAGLVSESHLVTDEQDTEICGYQQQM